MVSKRSEKQSLIYMMSDPRIKSNVFPLSAESFPHIRSLTSTTLLSISFSLRLLKIRFLQASLISVNTSLLVNDLKVRARVKETSPTPAPNSKAYIFF